MLQSTQIPFEQDRALLAVERLQQRLKKRGELPAEEKLSLLKSVLQSPLFNQILNMQETGQQHENQQVRHHHHHSPSHKKAYTNTKICPNIKHISLFESILFYLLYLLLFQGRTVLSFDLEKGVSALGISIIGLETESSGGHGIFIQKIQPDSVACSDGRLHKGDQILAVNARLL
uniref:PDZ domain-containing protein n=1 Tax=Cyprinus carpio TaxID=7962 RepID=A0A8C2G0B2_CYPCA